MKVNSIGKGLKSSPVRHESPLLSISPFGKDFRAVLIFPGTYSIASSSLAFHQIFRLIGQHPDWSCERAVVEPSMPTRSIELNHSLDEFDLIAFTVPFESGYLQVIEALLSSSVPVYARERGPGDPIVLMGGIAAAANPDVMAPFVDLFLLGEAEASLPAALEKIALLLRGGSPRSTVLEECVNLPGAYVPSIQGDQPPTISFARTQDMDAFPPCSGWLSPETEFDNTFLFEISRGCPCGCRFCMIRLSQKPLRAVSVDRIMELVGQLPLQVPGVNGEMERPRIGLVGAAVASHPQFEEICSRLREEGWEITASAIEIDKVTDGILDLLAESQKTLTLAPERGLESERYRLGKRISDHHLLDVARKAGALGMPRLKLYFVCGIVAPEFYGSATDRPGAPLNLPDWLSDLTDFDAYCEQIFNHEADAVADLVDRLTEVFQPQGQPGTIGVTCSPFIPKPHTPWEAWPMAAEKGLKQLDRILKKKLGQKPRVRYRPISAWESIQQGILSQGGRNLAPYLVHMVRFPEERRRIVREIIETSLVQIHERRWQNQDSPWAFIHL